MTGVLVGFAIIGAIILVGYIVGRLRVLGDHSAYVLSRIAFYVLTPCLLFTVLADADVHVLFSTLLLVSAIAAVTAGLLFATISRVFFKRPVSETVIGTLSSAYVNGNNIGIPVAVYVLGDAALSAPIVLLQLLVFVPITLTILDVQERGRASVREILTRTFTTPMIVASLIGVLFSVFEFTPPEEVMAPFRIIGAAAVPVLLIAFGMSLHGNRVLAPGSPRRDVFAASAIKLAFMPVVAWLVGGYVFGLSGHSLFTVVVLAALPTAQNVFNYAQRYDRGVLLARDVTLITTILSVPALVVIAALLAPR